MEINNTQELIGTIVIFMGLAFMVFGVFGIFFLKDFYPRILVASKVDTVGLLTLVIGFMIRSGFNFFSAKLLLLVIIILLLNPLVAHIMVRSANISGYEVIEDTDEDIGADKIMDESTDVDASECINETIEEAITEAGEEKSW